MTAVITFPPLAPLGTAALEKISVSELICFFQSPVHAFRMPHLRGWKDTLKWIDVRGSLQETMAVGFEDGEIPYSNHPLLEHSSKCEANTVATSLVTPTLLYVSSTQSQ